MISHNKFPFFNSITNILISSFYTWNNHREMINFAVLGDYYIPWLCSFKNMAKNNVMLESSFSQNTHKFLVEFHQTKKYYLNIQLFMRLIAPCRTLKSFQLTINHKSAKLVSYTGIIKLVSLHSTFLGYPGSRGTACAPFL